MMEASAAKDGAPPSASHSKRPRRDAGSTMKDVEGTNGDHGAMDSSGYYDAYVNMAVHSLMLKDKVRTETYRAAIEKSRPFIEGKCVMDVGAGTGILSLFAAREGKAERVCAVEASGMAIVCQQIVEDNNMESIIEVQHKRAEELPPNHFRRLSLMVSEWMGFYLLHESMLESVIAARDAQQPQHMFPDKCRLYAALINLDQVVEDKVSFWKDVYGFDYRACAALSWQESIQVDMVQQVKAHQLRSEVAEVLEFNMMTVKKEEVASVCEDVVLHSRGEGLFHGLCLWFECDFPVIDGDGLVVDHITLNTSPHHPQTHWRQTVVTFPPIDGCFIGADEAVRARIALQQSPSNPRHYEIGVELLDKSANDDEGDGDTIMAADEGNANIDGKREEMAADREVSSSASTHALQEHDEECDCIKCVVIRAYKASF